MEPVPVNPPTPAPPPVLPPKKKTWWQKLLAPFAAAGAMLLKLLSQFKLVLFAILKFGWPILKTGGTMLISVWVYAQIWGWWFAVGFVLLIFVHEMGHVVANVAYGLPASAPLFIPFLGAVINLRKNPPNAMVEAIVGIAGPIAGTIGALACFAWYLTNGSQFALELAAFGFWINLFNLLPVPPLDGGRVAAAISPWIWILGLIGLGLMVVADLKAGHQVGIFVLILIFALPRILKTLKPKGRSGPYYAIGRTAPLLIGAAYLALLVLLVTLRMYSEARLQAGGFL